MDFYETEASYIATHRVFKAVERDNISEIRLA